MVFAAQSYLDMGKFKVDLRTVTDENCSTLTYYLDLTIAPSSIATESALSISVTFENPYQGNSRRVETNHVTG